MGYMAEPRLCCDNTVYKTKSSQSGYNGFFNSIFSTQVLCRINQIFFTKIKVTKVGEGGSTMHIIYINRQRKG